MLVLSQRKGDDSLPEIEKIREQLNLTQREFSQAIGISLRSYMSRLAGDVGWTSKDLLKIHELCGDDIVIRNGIDTYRISITKI